MTGSNKKKAAAEAAPGTNGEKRPGDLSNALARAPSAAKQVARPTLVDLVQGGRVHIFLDANVLIPEYLRTVFLDMAEAGLFQPYWSPSVLEETRRNLIDPDIYGLEMAKVDQLLKCLNEGFPGALVQGSEKYVAAFKGKTDSKDQHVAAGALKVSQSVHEGLRQSFWLPTTLWTFRNGRSKAALCFAFVRTRCSVKWLGLGRLRRAERYRPCCSASRDRK